MPIMYSRNRLPSLTLHDQTVTPTVQPPDYRVGIDFLLGTSTLLISAFLRLTFTYADGTRDFFVMPFRDETRHQRVTGDWMRIVQICPVRSGVVLSSVRYEVVSAGIVVDNLLLQENLMPDEVEKEPPLVEPSLENPYYDAYGLNPTVLKNYPNMCWNSGFERYDMDMKPFFWDTTGIVVLTEWFDGTASLRLSPGNHAKQRQENNEGLIHPSRWPHFSETRFSFRAKGVDGAILCRVQQGIDPVTELPIWLPLWSWEYFGGSWNKLEGTSLTFNTNVDWHDGLYTFVAVPDMDRGAPLQLQFINVGNTLVFIDNVILEPDRTGRWPSFYTDGPESAAHGTRGIAYYVPGPLVVGTRISFKAPIALRVNRAVLEVDVAPAGSDIIVDILRDGVSLYPQALSRATIVAGSTTGVARSPRLIFVPPGPPRHNIPAGGKVTLEILQVGATTPGENLSVTVICEVI